MENILIKNATIVDSGQTIQADVFIKDGIIEKIDSSISLYPNTKLIMADNQYILPGVIDTHVHFREPGMTNKGTFASESAAAVAGGVTTVVDMPNTIPSATTPELIENKYAIAEKSSLVNYSFMIGATDKNIDDILRLDPRRIAAVKVFLGSSTGNLCIKEPSAIEKVFVSSPILIAAHCEDDAIIKENLARIKAEYGDNIPSYMHSEIRNEEACYKSSQYAVELAKKTGARLHLLHISTKKELSLLQNIAYNSTKKITGEACIHHLFFNQTDYSSKDNLIKVNPSIKTKEDQEALWEALLSGCLDTIATD
ncbi:MAG: amidohydrolase family protein, partial [Flavobacteriales bacterium]|nr:amidohydrolase family protein [Flavobacteriales bacterium]